MTIKKPALKKPALRPADVVERMKMKSGRTNARVGTVEEQAYDEENSHASGGCNEP